MQVRTASGVTALALVVSALTACRPDYYATLAALGQVANNPHGPASSFDPVERGSLKRVHRGGSFLCTSQYCSRYLVGTRGKGEVSTASNHLGFRTIRRDQRPWP